MVTALIKPESTNSICIAAIAVSFPLSMSSRFLPCLETRVVIFQIGFGSFVFFYFVGVKGLPYLL